jgi:peptide/nickel transport system permease protein/glutathione transport system permease protein
MAVTTVGIALRVRQLPRFRAPALPLVCVGILAIVLAFAVAGPWIAPQDPYAQDLSLGVQGPSAQHWLGTDQLGRDVLSRVIVGTLPSIFGPVLVVIGTGLIGIPLGLLAGYRGGALDHTVSRVADLVYAMPGLLLAIVVVGVTGGNYIVTVVVLVVLFFPGNFRMVRSASLVQARLPYVDAARTMGVSTPLILIRHLLPNVLPTVVASVLLDFAAALMAFSALAFLGLGVQPGGVDWGTMIAAGQGLIYLNPMLSLAPSFLIILTATSVTIVGDWLYDRMSTVRSAR